MMVLKWPSQLLVQSENHPQMHCHEEFFSGKVVNNAEQAQHVLNMLGHSRHQCPYCHGTATYQSTSSKKASRYHPIFLSRSSVP
jgi:hypothetical protein